MDSQIVFAFSETLGHSLHAFVVVFFATYVIIVEHLLPLDKRVKKSVSVQWIYRFNKSRKTYLNSLLRDTSLISIVMLFDLLIRWIATISTMTTVTLELAIFGTV